MAFCRNCGKEVNEDKLSQRGLCQECGYNRVEESVRQMMARSGPLYDKYKAGLAKYLERMTTSEEDAHGAAERATADC